MSVKSYASLINTPAMPKSTKAAPMLSSDRATIPLAATHDPAMTSILSFSCL